MISVPTAIITTIFIIFALRGFARGMGARLE